MRSAIGMLREQFNGKGLRRMVAGVACLLVGWTVSATAQVTAVPANEFLNSLGINTHISQGVNWSTYTNGLVYTGLRNIRDGNNSGTMTPYIDLHAAIGTLVEMVGAQNSNSMTWLINGSTTLANSNALLALEGPNEPNNFTISYEGVYGGGTGSWVPVANFQRDFFSNVVNSAILSNYPVFNVTEGGGEEQNVGLQFLTVPAGSGVTNLYPAGTQFADYANCHNYVTGNNHNWTNNAAWMSMEPAFTQNSVDGLYGNYGLTWRKSYTGYTSNQLVTLPRVNTENGWQTTNGPVNGGIYITETNQANLCLNLFLDAYKRGWSYIFLYQMKDDQGGSSNTWGIYRGDGTAKPAATYIHNLTTILADTNSIAPGNMNYSISNETATVHDLLLQKSSGTFYLAVWDEETSATDDIAVNLGATATTVQSYDPTIGTGVQQTWSNVSSVDLTVSNHPLFLAISGLSGGTPPTASFTGSPTNGVQPLNVAFTDTSSGSPTSWAWNFGDTGTSTLQDPSHTYTTAGVYTVSLIAGNAYGSSTNTLTGYINVSAPPPPPTASFTGSPTSGVQPLNVTFTDTSSGSPTSWAWNFGDTGTSTLQDPSHTFSTAGVYTVQLIASNAGGSSTNTQSGYITVSVPPPTASFTGSPTNGAPPLNVTFTDTSSGSPTSWAWNFGDTGTSTLQDPSHTFSTAGVYTVQLIASNAGGSSTNTQSGYITVLGSGLPSPWTNQDIGAVGIAGSTTYSNGVFTVTGSGAAMGSTTTDAFQYVYQPVSGNCSITALLATQSAQGKAGLMIRNTLTVDSPFADSIRWNGAGKCFEFRTVTAGTGVNVTGGTASPPYWFRVTRTGNAFAGYASPDGTNWTQVGTSTNITMNSNVYIGLAVSSCKNSTNAVATFQNVTLP